MLRIENWGLEPLSESNGAILVPTPDFPASMLSTVATNPGTPVLAFTQRCWQEIRFLTKHFAHREWAVLLTTKRMSDTMPHFLAFDWVMPKQEASAGEVSIKPEDYLAEADRLREEVPYYQERGVHRFLAHLHSHHSMALRTFSSVDDAQQTQRGDIGFMDAYRMYAVVTTDSIKASFVYYDPAVVRINAAVAVIADGSDLTKARITEIKALAEERIKSPAPAVTVKTYQTYNWKKDYWRDEYGFYGE